MHRKGLIILALVTACGIVPSVSMADPVDYCVSGSTSDRQGNILHMSGEMQIDDQLRNWQGGEPADVQSGGQFQYRITDFSLNVGEYFFSGSGSLYMEVYGLDPADLTTGDLMWFLTASGSDSQWDEWIGEHFLFFNSRLEPENVLKEFVGLADVIELNSLMYLFNDPILPEYDPGFTLRLSHGDAVPSPEPSTLILMGVGLAGFLIRGRGTSHTAGRRAAAPAGDTNAPAQA